MPKSSGVYCALAGSRLKQGDALGTGVLTHAVAQSSLTDVEQALETASDIDEALKPFLVVPEKGPLLENEELVEEAFSGRSVEDVLDRLDRSETDFGQKTAKIIREKSPTSVLIAFEQMQRGKDLSFNECMTPFLSAPEQRLPMIRS